MDTDVVFPSESMALPPTVWAVLIALGLFYLICSPFFQKGKKFKTRMIELLFWLAIVVFGYVAVNLIWWCLSWIYSLTGWDDRGDKSLTTTMVTEEVYDFTSGKPYPTSIGEGNTEYLHLSVPGSDGATNVVAIPLDKIDFIQESGVTPSVVINLNDSDANDWADYDWQRATHKTRVVWGWWTQAVVKHGYMVGVETDRTLPEIIAAETEHVELTVTPAEYERIVVDLDVTD